MASSPDATSAPKKKFRRPGYTQIPNEIFDELMPSLTGAQFKVLCLIARKTLGFHRECHAMPLALICRGTGLSHQGILDATEALCKAGWIEKSTSEGKSVASVYSLAIEEEADSGINSVDTSGVKSVDPYQEVGVKSVDPYQEVGVNLLGSNSVEYIKEIQELKEKDHIPHSPSQELQNQPREADVPILEDCDEDGIVVEPPKYRKRWQKKPKPPEDPNSHSNIIRRLREQTPTRAVVNGASQAASPLTSPTNITPNSATASVAPKTGIPEEVEIWNEIVTSGTKVTAFAWEMEEGRNLARCREDVRFTGKAWRLICEKAQIAIENECGWVTFRWLIKNNNNWWKTLQGEYDNYKPKNARRSRVENDNHDDEEDSPPKHPTKERKPPKVIELDMLNIGDDGYPCPKLT